MDTEAQEHLDNKCDELIDLTVKYKRNLDNQNKEFQDLTRNLENRVSVFAQQKQKLNFLVGEQNYDLKPKEKEQYGNPIEKDKVSKKLRYYLKEHYDKLQSLQHYSQKIKQISEFFTKYQINEINFHKQMVSLKAGYSTRLNDNIIQKVLDLEKQKWFLRVDYDYGQCWFVRQDHIGIPNTILRNYQIKKMFIDSKYFTNINFCKRYEYENDLKNHKQIVSYFGQNNSLVPAYEHYIVKFDKFVNTQMDNCSQHTMQKNCCMFDLIDGDFNNFQEIFSNQVNSNTQFQNRHKKQGNNSNTFINQSMENALQKTLINNEYKKVVKTRRTPQQEDQASLGLNDDQVKYQQDIVKSLDKEDYVNQELSPIDLFQINNNRFYENITTEQERQQVDDQVLCDQMHRLSYKQTYFTSQSTFLRGAFIPFQNSLQEIQVVSKKCSFHISSLITTAKILENGDIVNPNSTNKQAYRLTEEFVMDNSIASKLYYEDQDVKQQSQLQPSQRKVKQEKKLKIMSGQYNDTYKRNKLELIEFKKEQLNNKNDEQNKDNDDIQNNPHLEFKYSTKQMNFKKEIEYEQNSYISKSIPFLRLFKKNAFQREYDTLITRFKVLMFDELKFPRLLNEKSLIALIFEFNFLLIKDERMILSNQTQFQEMIYQLRSNNRSWHNYYHSKIFHSDKVSKDAQFQNEYDLFNIIYIFPELGKFCTKLSKKTDIEANDLLIELRNIIELIENNKYIFRNQLNNLINFKLNSEVFPKLSFLQSYQHQFKFQLDKFEDVMLFKYLFCLKDNTNRQRDENQKQEDDMQPQFSQTSLDYFHGIIHDTFNSSFIIKDLYQFNISVTDAHQKPYQLDVDQKDIGLNNTISQLMNFQKGYQNGLFSFISKKNQGNSLFMFLNDSLTSEIIQDKNQVDVYFDITNHQGHLTALREIVKQGISQTFLGINIEEFESKNALQCIKLMIQANKLNGLQDTNKEKFLDKLKAGFKTKLNNNKEEKLLNREQLSFESFIEKIFAPGDNVILNELNNIDFLKIENKQMDFYDKPNQELFNNITEDDEINDIVDSAQYDQNYNNDFNKNMNDNNVNVQDQIQNRQETFKKQLGDYEKVLQDYSNNIIKIDELDSNNKSKDEQTSAERIERIKMNQKIMNIQTKENNSLKTENTDVHSSFNLQDHNLYSNQQEKKLKEIKSSVMNQIVSDTILENKKANMNDTSEKLISKHSNYGPKLEFKLKLDKVNKFSEYENNSSDSENENGSNNSD